MQNLFDFFQSKKGFGIIFSSLVILFAIPIYTYLQNNKVTSRIAGEGDTIEGKIAIVIEDNFEQKKSVETYYVVSEPDNEVKINPTDLQKQQLSSGESVSVSGIAKNKLVITENTPNFMDQLGPTKSVEEIPVILINFTNSPPNSVSRQAIEQQVLVNVRDYFTKVSYGKTTLNTPMHGWYTISPPPSGATCASNREWIKSAVQAADPEIDFTNIERFLIIFAGTEQCYTGAAILHPDWPVQTQEGLKSLAFSYASLSPTYFDLGDSEIVTQVALHEILHTFGLLHANGLDCGASRSMDPPACENLEYTDLFDVMGGGNQYWHLNVPHKKELGWLEDSQVLTVAESGTYTIYPIEIADGKVKGIRIFRKDSLMQSTIPQYLYVEYRQPIPPDVYDNVKFPWMQTNAYNGALLHVNQPESDSAIRTATQLIDAVPQSPITSPPYESALLPNIPFTDPLTGVKLLVTQANSASLQIQVTFPQGTPSVTPSPPATVTPTQDPTPTGPLGIICDPDSSGVSAGVLDFADLRLIRQEIVGVGPGGNRGSCMAPGSGPTDFADLRRMRRILAGLES